MGKLLQSVFAQPILFSVHWAFLRHLIQEIPRGLCPGVVHFETCLRKCIAVMSDTNSGIEVRITGRSAWVQGKTTDEFAVEYFLSIKTQSEKEDVIAKNLLDNLKTQLVAFGLFAKDNPTTLQMYRQIK